MALQRLVKRFRNTRIDYVCPECARAFELPYEECPLCDGDCLYRVVQ